MFYFIGDFGGRNKNCKLINKTVQLLELLENGCNHWKLDVNCWKMDAIVGEFLFSKIIVTNW